MRVAALVLVAMGAWGAQVESSGQAGPADGRRPVDPAPDIAALQKRIADLSSQLREVEARLIRALRAVPSGEEFRQQVAAGRQGIEQRRAVANTWWTEVKRIASALGVTLDNHSLRNIVPDALKGDAEFMTARKRAVEESKWVNDLEERLIKVMLTTTFETGGPAREIEPNATALSQEWANLAANQKSLGAAVQNAQRKAAAAKVAFDPSELAQPPGAAGLEGDRGFIDARERARIQLKTRDATAELVAALEFSRAAGPLEVNW